MKSERREKFGKALIFAVIFATLAFVSIGCASADTIYVPDNYAKIQWAVDNASAGDTIIVRDGTYTENVDVNVDNLTIQSENGSINCIVYAANSSDHVFEVKAYYVNISGFFMLKSATVYPYGGGVYLDNVEHCNISNNNVSNNDIGIKLRSSSNNTLSNNTISESYFDGIGLGSSRNNIITNNTVSNNNYGIYLHSSSDNIITNNIASSNHNEGIYLYSSSDNIITNNTANSNHYSEGIGLEYSSNNMLSNNIANSNHNYGIYLYSSSDNIITNNTANSNDNYGIYLHSTTNNTLTKNTMSGNTYNFGVYGSSLHHFIHEVETSNLVDGKPIYYWVNEKNKVVPSDAGFVGLVNSTNISVRDLTLTDNCKGILFAYTCDSRIENVNVSNNDEGIYLYSSNNNTLENNTANANNNHGVYLYSSTSNTLTKNTMSGNTYNFGVYGSSLHHFIHEIETSNLVDEKPICYWVNEKNKVVPSDAGFVGLVSSTNISVRNLTLANNCKGILFAYTNDSRIENINALDNDEGIYLYSSNHNIIMNNTVSNNNYGIYLHSSNHNIIKNSTANSNNDDGIYLYSSSNNMLLNNTASNNGEGIYPYLYSSNDPIVWTNIHGIYIDSSNHNIIKNNTANSNKCEGIYMYSSINNMLYNNTASNNYADGIGLGSSSNNTIYNNSVSNNHGGIYIQASSNNIITNNTALNNDYGIHMYSSSNNLIYNNYFDNTNNARDNGNNVWNVTKTAGTNIIGGSWLSGNYWSDYVGDDTDGDGLGDTQIPYNSAGNITNGGDWHPLVPSTALNCTCGDICVNETGWWRDGGAFNASDTPIQSAVNNANAGKTICVKDGTYIENVGVAVNNLTIKSENGAALTIVNASNPDDHVFEVTADYVTISGFMVEGATGTYKAGIYLYDVNHCEIFNNTCLSNERGICLGYSGGNTLRNNTLANNSYNFYIFGFSLEDYTQDIDTTNMVNGKPIYYLINQKDVVIDASTNAGYVGMVNSVNVTVKDIILTNNSQGVLFAFTINSNIKNVNASKNEDGIELFPSSNSNTIENNTCNLNNGNGIHIYWFSNNNILINNTCNLNSLGGIYLSSSSGNTLRGNTCNSTNSYSGIRLYGSSHNTIENNTLANNMGYGISLVSSNSNTIKNNTCSNNRDGIHLLSSNNTLRNNTMTNKRYNFCIEGGSLENYIHDIDTSNKVNGKPMYYLVNQRNVTIDASTNAGFVAAINSTNVTVRELTLTNNYQGVLLAFTNNSRIENINVSNNWYGIRLYLSANNILTNNTCLNNQDGISLDSSNDILTNNTCLNNGFGIRLYPSRNNNTLRNNICSNNYYGIYLYASTNGNFIYLNNFIDNNDNVYSPNLTNIWNSTEKIIYTYNGSTYTNYTGNYWDDYEGADANGDGIGDNPYIIDGNNDNYPLTEPWENYFAPVSLVFDTGSGTYPSIMGTHTGTIKSAHNINVSTLYTYPCAGTGGHTKSIKLYDENDTLIANGSWNGYQDDYHNITITPFITLLAGHTYNYTIVMGSYPQIIHEPSKDVTGGTITCTNFTDANGVVHYDWIPAIRLYDLQN